MERFLEGGDLLTNDLELPSLEMLSDISDAKDALAGTGASFVRMTGSGSAVFAMYDSEDARDKAYEQIKNDPKFKDCDLFSTKTI